MCPSGHQEIPGERSPVHVQHPTSVFNHCFLIRGTTVTNRSGCFTWRWLQGWLLHSCASQRSGLCSWKIIIDINIIIIIVIIIIIIIITNIITNIFTNITKKAHFGSLMISPDIRQSLRFSSSTVFKFSIHSGST